MFLLFFFDLVLLTDGKFFLLCSFNLIIELFDLSFEFLFSAARGPIFDLLFSCLKLLYLLFYLLILGLVLVVLSLITLVVLNLGEDFGVSLL